MVRSWTIASPGTVPLSCSIKADRGTGTGAAAGSPGTGGTHGGVVPVGEFFCPPAGGAASPGNAGSSPGNAGSSPGNAGRLSGSSLPSVASLRIRSMRSVQAILRCPVLRFGRRFRRAGVSGGSSGNSEGSILRIMGLRVLQLKLAGEEGWGPEAVQMNQVLASILSGCGTLANKFRPAMTTPVGDGHRAHAGRPVPESPVCTYPEACLKGCGC